MSNAEAKFADGESQQREFAEQLQNIVPRFIQGGSRQRILARPLVKVVEARVVQIEPQTHMFVRRCSRIASRHCTSCLWGLRTSRS